MRWHLAHARLLLLLLLLLLPMLTRCQRGGM